MRTAKTFRCAACKKRIRAHEPDAILEDLSGGDSKPRYFHERCGEAAYQLALERPTVYVLTVRRVVGDTYSRRN